MKKQTVYIILDIIIIIFITIFFIGSDLMDSTSLRKEWEAKNKNEEIDKEKSLFDTLKRENELLIEQLNIIRSIIPVKNDTIEDLRQKGDSLIILLNTKKLDIEEKNSILIQLKEINFKLRVEYYKLLFNSYKVVNIKIENKQEKEKLENELKRINILNRQTEDFLKEYKIAHPYNIKLACYPKDKKDKPCHKASNVEKITVFVTVTGCVYKPDLIYFVLFDPNGREVSKPIMGDKSDIQVKINGKDTYVSRIIEISKQEEKAPIEFPLNNLIPGIWYLKAYDSKGSPKSEHKIELK